MTLSKILHKICNILYVASIGEITLSDIMYGFKRFIVFLINMYDPEGAKADFSGYKNINSIAISIYHYKICIGLNRSNNIEYANTLSYSKTQYLKS